MNIGVSSSCFYPLETEKSLVRLGELGVKTAEVFFNSPSELRKEFTNELCRTRDSFGMDIISFHPFMSFAEGFYIFSDYKRRFYDGLEIYKPMFEVAASIGAKFFVLHGSKTGGPIEKSEYAERFFEFSSEAKKFGITVAHENVVNYIGQSPEFMTFMKKQLGEDFKMVLDIKQARRAGVDPFDFISAVKDSIVHLHLSDYNEKEDCKPPQENGNYDFGRLFGKMNDIGYKGDAVVEVYSKNYRDDSQLRTSMLYLQSLADNI